MATSRESSVGGGGVGSRMGMQSSPGPSQWRSSAVRTGNMFEEEPAHYAMEDNTRIGSQSGSGTQKGSPSEDELHIVHENAPGKTTVTRVAKACVNCSSKKRRCDGSRPQCKVCMVLGTPCSYESKGLKRGPPKGFRSGPKESARARLLRTLETTLRDLSLHIGPHETAMEVLRISQDRGVVLSGLPTSVLREGGSSSSKRLKRATSEPSGKDETDEGEEEQDFLGINEQGSVRHFGSSSGIQLLRSQPPPASSPLHHPSNMREGEKKRVTSNGSPSPYPLPAVPSRLHGIATSTSRSSSPLHSPQTLHSTNVDKSSGYVSPEMNRRLFENYWEIFHPFWPVLYKPAFDELSVDELPVLLDQALLNTIYAIAVCVASPALAADIEMELGDSPAGEVFFRRAEQQLFIGHTTPTPSLSSTQVCFFLALYCQGSGQLSKAWLYSSLANSMSLDLGLHRHLHHFDNNLIEKESRVRLVHCVYILSITLSAEMGRPPMLKTKDIDVPMLSEQEKDEYENDSTGSQLCTPSCLNASLRLFRIVETVLSQVHSQRRKAALRRLGAEMTRKVVDDIEYRLEQWTQSLPEPLRLSGQRRKELRPLPHFTAVHIWYHTALLLLNRPFIPHEEGTSLNEVLNDPCHAKCTKASNELFELLLQLANSNNVDRLLTDLAYCIFTAAVMFLFNARLGQSASGGDDASQLSSANRRRVADLSREAKMHFLMCKEWLRGLSDRWPAASSHKQLLDGFSSVGEDVLRESRGVGGTTHNEGEIPRGAIQQTALRSMASAAAWDLPRDREALGRTRRGALDASHEQVSTPASVVPSPLGGYGNSSTNFSPSGNVPHSMGTNYTNEGNYVMYPATSQPFDMQQQQMHSSDSQQEFIYRFAPNIFDMESVYWNETAARNPASSEASMDLNNAVQRSGLIPFSGHGATSTLHSISSAGGDDARPRLSAGPLPAVSLSDGGNTAASSSYVPQSQQQEQQRNSTNGLQMLAQATTTAGLSQVSPLSFHQEPSQPEWNDVINMLQLPPAFLQ